VIEDVFEPSQYSIWGFDRKSSDVIFDSIVAHEKQENSRIATKLDIFMVKAYFACLEAKLYDL